MSQPTPYTRGYSFKSFQVANPTTPLPGDKVDIELNRIKTTLDQLLVNVALIQRDDGAIGNSLVGLPQLDGSLISLAFDRPTNWATATVYEVDSAVFKDNKLYICLTEHTSTVFATDLALVKWIETIDFTTLITDAQTAANSAASYASDALGSSTAAAASAASTAATLAASVLKAGDTMSGPLVVSSSTLAAHAASLANVQNDVVGHATVVGGTVDAIQLTMSPASTTWALHERIRWTSAGVNTITNPTVSKNGGVANIVIKKAAGSALATSDLGAAGYEVECEYNGTNVILLNPASVTGYTVAAQTEETVPAIGDFLGGYDISATAERKFTTANIFKVINGLTEDTGPDVDNDFFPSYDASASSGKKVKIRSILKTINSLTADATPDPTADYVPTYDASASDAKKVLLSKLGSPVNVQSFTGSGTWTKPSTGTMAFIRLWGAGGSGAGKTTGGTSSGGGGGGFTEKWILLSSLAATETVTIAAGGVAVAVSSGGHDGNAGGNSTFGAWLTAYGGDGGRFSTVGNGAFGGFGAGATSGSSGMFVATSSKDAKVSATSETGGGPGGGVDSGGTTRAGGDAFNGGAGGGGASLGSQSAGGTSINGGAGGTGNGSGSGTAGTAPSGGGGAAYSSGNSGAGAAGRCEVFVF